MSQRTFKRLNANIRENKSFTREQGSGRHQKQLEAHRSFKLKLLTDFILIIPEIGFQSNYKSDIGLKLTGRLALDF